MECVDEEITAGISHVEC